MFQRQITRTPTNRMTELSNEHLAQYVPATATEGSIGRTERYKPISTMSMINALRDVSWIPVFAFTQRKRNVQRIEYSKHVIAFKKREPDGKWLSIGDGLFPELLLTNSHDGTSAYKLLAGLFRLICTNGMVANIASLADLRIRHTGDAPAKAVEASFQVLENVPTIAGRVEDFSKCILTAPEARLYATGALIAKHGEMDEEMVGKLNLPNDGSGNTILSPRRYGDAKMDLFSVYNNVQENLTKGGKREFIDGQRARRITGMNADMKLNKKLWDLTEEFYALKTKKK